MKGRSPIFIERIKRAPKTGLRPWFCKGQSVTELAIFGSILIFIISLIFRQGMSAGNFMNSQLKATRYAMSKSLEGTSSPGLPTGRNTASTMIIEDRLSGDFSGKFGSRDRVPVVASAGATFSSQMLQPTSYPEDWGNEAFLPHLDMVINGQSFSFLTANFKAVTLPTGPGSLQDCAGPHPNDSRCWDSNCNSGQGCVRLHRIVQNYPGSGFNPASGGFDLDFDGDVDVPDTTAYSPNFKAGYDAGTGNMAFMWQWRAVPAMGQLSTSEPIDVDGDFHEEQVLDSAADANGRTTTVWVIDRQDGDLDFTADDRRPDFRVGLQDEAQMFSFTQGGTVYRLREGKLYDGRDDRYVRNANRNNHVDIVQRTVQLTNNTGRFCDGNTPLRPLEVERCAGTFGASTESSNSCFSQANIQFTCLDVGSLQLFVRSRVVNQGGRSWFTRTETK